MKSIKFDPRLVDKFNTLPMARQYHYYTPNPSVVVFAENDRCGQYWVVTTQLAHWLQSKGYVVVN